MGWLIVIAILAVVWLFQTYPVLAWALGFVVVALIVQAVRQRADAPTSGWPTIYSDPSSFTVSVTTEFSDRVPPPQEDRLTELPPDGLWLRPGNRGTIQVVGESHYQDNLLAIVGPRRPEGYRVKFTAAIVPEPENPHSADALSIRIHGLVVGYLSRADAQLYRGLAQRLRAMGRVGYCQAWVTGGWDRGRGDTGSFGVRLRLGEPHSQMKLLDSLEKASLV